MRPASVFLAACFATAMAGTVRGQQPPVAADKANFERLCGTCHEPERSTPSRRTRDQWLQTVNLMVARGAQGSDAELMAVVDYLTREHGRVNVNLGTSSELSTVLGITPAEADAIVQYRRQNGTFGDAAAVARVPGIDAAKLTGRSDRMVFGAATSLNSSTKGRVPVAALTAANNWPSVNGGPQREGWARPEAMLARDTVNGVKLIYSRSFGQGDGAVAPPLVLGNLISYRGFKEMLFLAGGRDNVSSVDAVLNREIWNTRLPVNASQGQTSNAACASPSPAIVMTGTAASGLGTGAGIRRPGALPAGVLPAAASSKNPLVIGLASGFGRNGLVLALGSDGRVYPLYQSNGAPFGNPIPFVPPASRVRGLALFDNTLYAATVDTCGGPNAVYAVDLADESLKVAQFATPDGSRGSAGAAVGNDGVVYVHTGEKLIALTPKDLKEKDHIMLPAAGEGISPAVFSRDGRDVIVAGGGNTLVLLDSAKLGGSDHRTPLASVEAPGTLRGAFATWEDPETGIRWIYAPVVKSPQSPAGGIAAFKVEERGGRPALTSAWSSPAMTAPIAPVVANGLVFALSAGSAGGHATLSILDAATGKELFTSGNTVRGVADPLTGLAVANGRTYFSTTDGTVYCFGIPTEN